MSRNTSVIEIDETKQKEDSSKIYSLSAPEIAVLDAIDAQAATLSADADAHLRNIIRGNKLDGSWKFDRQTNTFAKAN